MVGLILLASGLRVLEFEPAHRLPLGERAAIQPQLSVLAREIAEIPIWKLALSWALVVGIIGLIASVLSPQLRKAFLRSLIRFAAFVFILVFVVQRNPALLSVLDPLGPVGPEGPAGIEEVEAPPVFEPPHPSPLTVYLVSLAMLVGVGAAAWGAGRWWNRTRSRGARPGPLEDLGAIARRSLDDVIGGQDWGNAIIRCYDQMSHVVDRRRGLARPAAMTPSEFASRLQGAGLPGEPVLTLTRLFERARYGAHAPQRGEIEEAAACLTSIAVFCGEAV